MRLLTSRVLATGQTQEFGDVVELDAEEATRLIRAGQAAPAPELHETAAVAPPERRASKGATR